MQVNSYLLSNVNELEKAESMLTATGGSDCVDSTTYLTSCDCSCCSQQQGWDNQRITFDYTTTTPFGDRPDQPPPKLDTCLSSAVATSFSHVALLEVDDTTRVGYQYYGSSLGTYQQWPGTIKPERVGLARAAPDDSSPSRPVGTQWCPETYDPRFRDWCGIAVAVQATSEVSPDPSWHP